MSNFNRRRFVEGSLVSAVALAFAARAGAQATSLQDVGDLALGKHKATVYTAREIVTLDPRRASATAVAVIDGRIAWVGTREEVVAALGTRPHQIDTTFADKVIVPGFVAQHDHPVLAALTMASEILSIEDWVLPTGTVKAVRDKKDFVARLSAAVAKGDQNEPLLTWGYHPAFYGELSRAELDKISTTRPILVWGRSCHELFLNTAALNRGKVTSEMVNGFSPSAKKQSNFEKGHFYEQGMFGVLPAVAGMIATPERMKAGLEISRDYMHAKGVTFGNEPGGIMSKPVQDGVNAVFGKDDMPFRWSFMPDGKSLCALYPDDKQVITETEKLAGWYTGMTSATSKQVKLFSDGAIYSQLMQVREPYLDGHEGEWMTDKELFERAFRVYWDAGYQMHVHVNGDAGIERVMDALEANMARNPRPDHRTVLIHFAVSGADQIERLARAGVIVSGNPYYVTALADQYGKVGLGPERADNMVRLGDLDRGKIRWSLHSDMPMAPGDPLFLMWCAVNRFTTSGRVAGANQRVTAEDALRGITIEAAYSLKLENEMGTITPGKLANLTILDRNPLKVKPEAIRDIAVWGTVMEGKLLPAGKAMAKAGTQPQSTLAADESFTRAAMAHALGVVHPGHRG